MKKIFFLITFLALCSCNKNRVYNKFDRDFKDNRWLKTDVRTFDFTISDGNQNYDLLFDFSHVDEFVFNNIPIKMEIANPDGSFTTENFLLKITDANGKGLGDCSGDYCDLQQAVLENTKLAAGKYKVSISNGFTNDYLPNVLGIGIVVNRSKDQ
ncbi:hypothetical protein FNO01nite_05650 [Flavobacterium noncentrifugens]|uniref:Gliding motility-associated lipoprotein GldH n=1 Tax=Flavobacterium noncentrifugens TaxID=1128970 RepID=A0A1G8SM97_9FLAO|nr:gliding motility lipoprotein GldH [Flavobacterium noncentrifugens]GEP49893.1 hypothetical protein FNO01nite_05650 [Flavobacterium noncentrifugens]SDJ30378.1 gliding motility-associated lipoprotein GldH [Flavobacterium noncentrifugens]